MHLPWKLLHSDDGTYKLEITPLCIMSGAKHLNKMFLKIISIFFFMPAPPLPEDFQVHKNNYKHKLLDGATWLKSRLNKYGAKMALPAFRQLGKFMMLRGCTANITYTQCVWPG